MQAILGFLVVVALIATVGVLLVGLVGMARGGEFNKKYGNHLMRARVISQGSTVLLMLVYFAVVNL
jgi:hypothetical protein